MRGLIRAMALLVLAAASPLRAEIVAVPLTLPEDPLFLMGNQAVVLPFDAGRPLVNVSKVGVRLKGDETYFRDICWTFGDYGAGQWWRRDLLGLTAGLRDGEGLLGETALVYDPAEHAEDLGVSLDLVLILDNGGDWSKLADGTGAVVLNGIDCAYTPVYPEVCACDVAMTLTRVELVVATDGSVPARAAAWGAVKARYR